jgi:hypothetical protein
VAPESDDDVRRLFAETAEDVPAGAFRLGVQRRIASIRRGRIVGSTLALVVLSIVAVVVSPFIVASGALVAKSTEVVTGAFGNIGVTPIAFAVGLALSFYALLELRAR